MSGTVLLGKAGFADELEDDVNCDGTILCFASDGFDGNDDSDENEDDEEGKEKEESSFLIASILCSQLFRFGRPLLLL